MGWEHRGQRPLNPGWENFSRPRTLHGLTARLVASESDSLGISRLRLTTQDAGMRIVLNFIVFSLSSVSDFFLRSLITVRLHLQGSLFTERVLRSLRWLKNVAEPVSLMPMKKAYLTTGLTSLPFSLAAKLAAGNDLVK